MFICKFQSLQVEVHGTEEKYSVHPDSQFQEQHFNLFQSNLSRVLGSLSLQPGRLSREW